MSDVRTLPALFVSHGAPDLLLSDVPARRFLAELGRALPRPRAVVVASAHWTTRAPAVGVAERPATIHDFGGFADELHAFEYAAPGDPALARDVTRRLGDAGVDAELVERGLDHGAWVPLALLYPRADVPVVPLALQPARGPRHHVELGRALADLRDEGVLVLASGSATHNLRELGAGDAAPEWVRSFDAWIAERVERGAVEELVAYRELAPHAARNHPTEEHLLPLFVALGAAGDGARGAKVHDSVTYGTLAMSAYRFDAA